MMGDPAAPWKPPIDPAEWHSRRPVPYTGAEYQAMRQGGTDAMTTRKSRLHAELNPALDDAPRLRALRDYWRARCPADGGIPRRQDIDPTQLKEHLGSLFIAEPIEGGADFRYRLIGADLTAIHGHEFTGSKVSELFWGFSAEDAATVINAYQIVVRKHVILRAGGAVLWAGKDYLPFDSLHLPILSPDGQSTWLLGELMFLG
ncbi:MAG: PAS domain-containing protein [Ferrovibrio sp.]|nr:PAS domain-containing protein [Ferrovibrio sp.]